MNLKEQLDALLDATAFDSTGTKIGAVRQVYVDDSSGKVTFATVATGIFSADAIIPLHGARLLDSELHVDHTRDVVRDSPRPDHTEDALTPEQEVKLLEYYGIEAPSAARQTEAGAEADATAGATAGAAATGKTGPDGKAQPTQPKDTATAPAKSDATAPQSKAPAPQSTVSGPQSKAPAPQSTVSGPRDQSTTKTTPTTRETSPIAARKSPPKGDRDEKTPTATTTKPSTSEESGDSPRPAKASGPAPASASQSAAGDGRGKDNSGSRD